MKIACFKTGASSVFNALLMFFFFISSAPLIQGFKYSVSQKKFLTESYILYWATRFWAKVAQKAQTSKNTRMAKSGPKILFPTSPLKFCQQLFRDTFYIYLIMHYIKYISPPILGFKWDWSVAKCTEHYVASCTSFSFEQELHYSGGWRVPSPFQ